MEEKELKRIIKEAIEEKDNEGRMGWAGMVGFFIALIILGLILHFTGVLT